MRLAGKNNDWNRKTIGFGRNREETKLGFHGSQYQNQAPCGEKE